MKTTTEVRLQNQGGKETLQFLAAKMDNWDVTSLVDASKLDVKGLEKLVRNGQDDPVVVDVEISDKVVEQVINKLWGYAKHNYLQAVYGIPEIFRFQ
ncbi:MAG TPA: hypothetical protein VJ742_11890 [Nitrososphaera sp.]|nr:hypothetical protein [Nitrososphaera sp.]